MRINCKIAKWFYAGLTFLILFGLINNAEAQNGRPLEEISFLLPNPLRGSLILEGTELRQKFARLENELDRYTYICSDLETNPDRADMCESLSGSFREKIDSFAQRANEFNRRVRDANRNISGASVNQGKGMLFSPGKVSGNVKYFYKGQPVKPERGMLVDQIETGPDDSISLIFDEDNVLKVGPGTIMNLDSSAFDSTKSLSENDKDIFLSLRSGAIRFFMLRQGRQIQIDHSKLFTIGISSAGFFGRSKDMISKDPEDFIFRFSENGDFILELVSGQIDVIISKTGEFIVLYAGDTITVEKDSGKFIESRESSETIEKIWKDYYGEE